VRLVLVSKPPERRTFREPASAATPLRANLDGSFMWRFPLTPTTGRFLDELVDVRSHQQVKPGNEAPFFASASRKTGAASRWRTDTRGNLPEIQVATTRPWTRSNPSVSSGAAARRCSSRSPS